MQETVRFIGNFISALVAEAEGHGLVELARLLRVASEEADEQAKLLDGGGPSSGAPPPSLH